jgi:hypothetical protein
MSVAAFHEFGATSFSMPGARFQRRLDGLDSGTLEWFSPSLEAFNPGDAPPGYPGLVIQEVEIEEECEGRYVHRLQCLGVLGSKPNRKLKSSFRRTLDTFDEGSEEWIALGSGLIALGSSPSGHASMHCVDVTEEALESGYFRISASFRGLLGEKPYKRRIAVNEQILSPGDPVYLNVPGGWQDLRKSQFSFPKVVVMDTYVTTQHPNTAAIPGMMAPPDAPPIQNLYYEGTNVVFHWPWNWKLASIDADNVSSVWATTYTYEFVWPVLPG